MPASYTLPRPYSGVRDYVGRVLRRKPQPVDPRPPSARAVTRWILTHPGTLADGDRLQLKAALVNCPGLDGLTRHVRSCARTGFAHLRKRVLLA
ncbi:hypothetical protein [Streptomyces sp. Ac-502]|uniref:hypothetical protein n=1 Tax=Streptomyces sp. Ac-502 TaxID=3342801 RepID=UPI003862589A